MLLDSNRWSERYRACYQKDEKDPVVREAEGRARWDERAATFTSKPDRNEGYIETLAEMLDLAEGESVFDMGSGSGTLALPLARAGHPVIAVDFSARMLEELRASARKEGCADLIVTCQRAWSEDWSDLPAADVAVSSRSFCTDDVADGIAKLESKARDRVVLAIGAGDLPFREQRIFRVMGRDREAAMPPERLACIFNYLLSIGRFPTVSYIACPSFWRRDTREELVDRLVEVHAPRTAEEEERLLAFLDEHVVHDEARGLWTLDYKRTSRFAVLIWRAEDL